MSGLVSPGVHWNYDYSVREFEPQDPAVLENAAVCYDGLSRSCKQILAALWDARLPTWTGSAGDAYRSFLTRLENCTEDVDLALRRASGAARAASGATLALRVPAADVVDSANQVRQQHVRDGDSLLLDIEMAIVLGWGDAVIGKVRAALQALADDLDPPDQSLSALVLPPAPSTADPVLTTIMKSVAAAEAALGQDTRSIAALAQAKMELLFGGSQAAVDAMRGLSPAELAWLLDHLSEDDAARLLGGLDPKTDRAYYDFLAKNLPLDVLDRIADVDPNHYWQPFYSAGNNGLYYQRPGDPGGLPSESTSDLRQGGLGDCHLLASLGALETAHPGYLNEHITANANGTYTVELYDKDGNPLYVTVTPDVPYTNSSNDSAYAQSGSDGNLTAYQIYEKAIAQSRDDIDLNGQDGYANENGGWPQTDLPYLTGQDASTTDSSDVTAAQIQSGIDNHQAVTVTTSFDDKGDWYQPGDKDHPDKPYLVGAHVFYVTGIDTSVSPPMVTLVNPWGSDYPGSGTVHIPLDQLQDHTHSVQFGTP